MIGLVAVTKAGRAAAERLEQAWPDARRYDAPAAAALPRAFTECDAIVSFLAVGATVRLIAPLLVGKHTDPAVVCVDEALRFAVPVLGAHQGGGNDLARRVAETAGLLTGLGYRPEGVQLQASRLAPLPKNQFRLAAENPVFVLWGQR